jgi:hypothetical protein
MAAKRKKSGTVDGVYLLKLVLYLLAGVTWLKISHGETMSVPLPLGFLAGLAFTTHEHFQIDRKIEYALLLAAMLVGYFAPFGVYVSF